MARNSALAYKAKDNAIVVVEDLNIEAPKTKEFVAFTKNLKLDDMKILMVLSQKNDNVCLSARNLQKVNVIQASELNTYNVMDSARLVLTESSIAAIDQLLKA